MRTFAACVAHCVAAALPFCAAIRAADRVEELIARGDYANALPALEAARDAAERAGRRDPEVASVLNNLGSVYVELGRARDAQLVYERSLAMRRAAGEVATRDVANTLSNLGAVYLKLRLLSKAEQTLDRAAAIDEENANELGAAKVWINLGMVYEAEQRWSAAEGLFRKSLEVREHILGPVHQEVALSLNDLGVLLQTRHRLAEAGPLLERAVRIWQQELGENHPSVAAGFNNLGVLYTALDRAADAEKYFKQAIRIAAAALPSDHPNLASFKLSYAILLRRLGRKEEARALEESARAAREANRRRNLVGYTVDAQQLRR